MKVEVPVKDVRDRRVLGLGGECGVQCVYARAHVGLWCWGRSWA